VYALTSSLVSKKIRKEIAQKFAAIGFAISKSGLQKLLELNVVERELDKFIDKLSKGYFPRKERVLYREDIEVLFNGKSIKKEPIHDIEPKIKPALDLLKEKIHHHEGISENKEIVEQHSKIEALEAEKEEIPKADTFKEDTILQEAFKETMAESGIPVGIRIKRTQGGVAIEVPEEPSPSVESTGILLSRLSSLSKLHELVKEESFGIENQSTSEVELEYDFSVKTTKKRKPREEFDAEYVLKHFDPQKMFSRGVEEDFISLFRSRYEKLRKYIVDRINRKKALNPKLKEVRILYSSEVSIVNNSIVALIGVVNNFRELKQKNMYLIDMFDRDGVILAHVKKKRGDLILYPGDVIGIIGRAKRSSGKVIVYVESEDLVVFPEINRRKLPSEGVLKDIPDFKVAITSDIHVGSKHFMKDSFKKFIEWLNTSEEASDIKFLIIPGDLVDGVGVYPNQEKELEILDVYAQYEELASYLDLIDDSIEIIITPGNHDIVRPSLPQPPLPKEVLIGISRKVVSAPNPALIELWGNMRILTLHGVPLEDIIATAPGLSHDNPTDAMKFLLDRRHLAPCYGDKTPLQPLPEDMLVMEDDVIPDVFVTGHVHRFEYKVYKGVLLINGSTWQKQTPYQKTHGIHPIPGHVGIVDVKKYVLGHDDYISVKNFGE